MMRNYKTSRNDGMRHLKAILVALFVVLTSFCFASTTLAQGENSRTESANPNRETANAPAESANSNRESAGAPIESANSPTDIATTRRQRMAALMERFYADPTEEEIKAHPALYFRVWANKPLPPVRTFLFLLFVTLVVCELLPLRMVRARQTCARNFWKCFWSGILATFTMGTLARGAYMSHVGMPLAILAIGLLQFLLLMGFAVSATLIGQTILTSFGVKRSTETERRWIRRLGEPLLGCFLLSLLLIIPPLGPLPRVGVRLILLFCFLGLGAWFRTGLGTKEIGSASEI